MGFIYNAIALGLLIPHIQNPAKYAIIADTAAGRRQLPGTLNAMNGKTNKYDRVLEQHRRAKQAQEGMEMALADHRDALAAAALLNEALQQHRSFLDFGGDMSQALEWQKKTLEANGGLPQLLAKHQAALAAAAAAGQALERHQAALEAAGGLARIVAEHRMAREAAAEFQDITVEPGKRSGQPCIRYLRMTVYDVLEYMAGGMSDAELRDDFDLPQQDLELCRAFAAALDGRLQSGMAG